MDASVNNTVNSALALRDANLMMEVQASVTKKAINAQADSVATLLIAAGAGHRRHAGFAHQHPRLNPCRAAIGRNALEDQPPTGGFFVAGQDGPGIQTSAPKLVFR